MLQRKLVKKQRICESIVLISCDNELNPPSSPCRNNPQVKMMLEMFKPKVSPAASSVSGASDMHMDSGRSSKPDATARHQPFIRISDGFFYLSDVSEDTSHELEDDVDEEQLPDTALQSETGSDCHSDSGLSVVLPRKRHHLDIPYHVQRIQRRESHLTRLRAALADLVKMLKSARMRLVGGPNGLQAHCCHVIRAHLDLVVRNQCLWADAAEWAAETNGFSPSWGGCQLHGWTYQWVTNRKLPESFRGRHAKTASVLAIPSIKTELRAYLQSNKWSVDPATLAKFTANEMLPKEAARYLRNLVDDEMPLALKRYLELELFPRVH